MKKNDDKLERTVLSGIIGYKSEQDKAQQLHQDNFYDPKHKEILRCIHLIQSESGPVDIFTIKTKMNPALCDLNYLLDVTESHILPTHLDHAIFQLKQSWMIREITAKCERAIIKLNQHDAQPIDIIDYLDTELKNLTTNQSERFDHIPETATITLKNIEKIAQQRAKAQKEGKRFVSGVPSGLWKLDELTGGFQKTDLIIIAARPAMGKTALLTTIAKNASFNFPVGVFSLEMSTDQLTKRLISSGSGITVMQMNQGNINASDWKNMNSAVEDLQRCNIIINDQAGQTINQIRYKAKIMQKEHGIKLLLVDYLQLIHNPVRGLSKNDQVGGISSGLKELAKEMDIPIIALAQLSRAVETRGGDKKPILSDLRDSGNIEQDADVIGFLYRPEYYKIDTDEEGNSTKGIGWILVEKNRNGSTAELPFIFDGPRTEWRDIDTLQAGKKVDYNDAPF